MKLYKYSLSNGLNILEEEKIKVTPPKDFNDPFESLIREKNSTKTPINPITVNLQSENYVNKISGIMGILCFSAIPDSLLMWSHYCDGLRGIVIEFDTSNEIITKYWKTLHLVNYSKKRFTIIRKEDGAISSEKDTADIVTTKSAEWAYENEYRYIFRLSECEQHTGNGKTKYYTGIEPTMITKIILGEKCSKDTFQKAKNILKDKRFSHVEHSVALRCSDTYQINILDNTTYQKFLTSQSS